MHRVTMLLVFLSLLLAGSNDKLYGEDIDVYARTLQTERSRAYVAIHYRIKPRFDESKGMFWGETVITLRPLSDDFEACSFDAEKFTVSSVRDQSGQPLEFHHCYSSRHPGLFCTRTRRFGKGPRTNMATIVL